MNIAQALRLSRQSRVALVGAGGKTTALFQAARALEMPVVVTSTTHLGAWQAEFADRHLIVSRPGDLEGISGQIEGVTLISGPEGKDQRLGGLDPETLDVLRELADQLAFPVLVEADGSRLKPLKAPDTHEPVIPSWVDTVIVTAGLSGIGRRLDEKLVHRPKLFSALSGRAVGEVIEEKDLAQVLSHPAGGLKGIPAGARVTALFNQVEDEVSLIAALRIAKLVQPFYGSIVIAALREQKIYRVIEPCAGVVLAGGESSRFGRPKMLLEWHGKPLIRHVIEAALGAELSEVIVVTGAVDEPVRQAIENLPVRVQHNPDWKSGQGSSVGQGVVSIAENTGSAIFMLADQPYVSSEVILALIQRHQETLASVIALRVGARRANPVLFDRMTFQELMALEGDIGGRAIMERYGVDFVDWSDERLLFDIDTPDDYQRLIESP